MKLFILKSVCLLLFALLTVYAGLQMADDGIKQIKRYDDSSLHNRSLQQDGDNHSFIEGSRFSHDLSAKQRILEEMNNFNIFTFMGGKLTLCISKTAEKLISLIADS
jgi:hypothetical protein